MLKKQHTTTVGKRLFLWSMVALLLIGLLPNVAATEEAMMLSDWTPLRLTLHGTKTMQHTLPFSATFGFIAYPANTNPEVGDPLTGEVTVREEGDYAFSFSPKTFTQPGDYTYTIAEINGGVKGVIYDTTSYVLTVTVGDNGDGTLNASATLDGEPFDMEQDAVPFSNRYAPNDVPLTLIAQTTLKAYDAQTDSYRDTTVSAGAFRFQVKDKDSGRIVTTGTNDVDGKIDFNTFYFSASMLKGVVADANGDKTKPFTLEISEVIPVVAKDPNMLYDTAVYEIEAVLTYAADGTLSVAVGDDADGTADVRLVASFVNYSNPDEVTVRPIGVKTTVDAPEDATFSFAVVNIDSENEAAVGVGVANGDIAFSDMSFSEVGTYSYWIYESNAGNTTNGITYDAARYRMQVDVTRNAYQRLEASVTYWASATVGATDAAAYTVAVEYPTFRNVYAAAGYIRLTASVVLEGRDLREGEFAFRLTRADNHGEIDGLADESGHIVFSTMYYSMADIPDGETSAIIPYTMSEVIPQVAAESGVIYDTNTYEVYVRITDHGDGTIHAELVTPENGDYVAMADQDTGVVFHNVYAPVHGDSVRFRVKKSLVGRELRVGEYDFLLSTADRIVNVATNDADGLVVFSLDIPPTTAQGIHTFYVHEAYGSLQSMIYDRNFYPIYVQVTDDGYGSVVAAMVDENGQLLDIGDDGVYDLVDSITFINRYAPNDVLVQLEAEVRLTGRSIDDKEFSFTIRENDVNGEIVAGGSNDANGHILFSAFEVTAADMADAVDMGHGVKQKLFTYIVAESDNRIPGVTTDTAVHTVEVLVTDDGKGALEAVIADPNHEMIVFENCYEPEPVSVPITAVKVLDGKSLTDGAFRFVMTDENGQIVREAVNAENGHVAFEPLVFTEAGTFAYTIAEKNDGAEGVTYDSSVYTMTVTVTDDYNGRLTALVVYHDGEMIFKNTYIPVSDDKTPPANKPSDTAKPDTTKPDEPKGDAPKTGDIGQAATVAAIGGLGFAMVGVLWMLRRRHAI